MPIFVVLVACVGILFLAYPQCLGLGGDLMEPLSADALAVVGFLLLFTTVLLICFHAMVSARRDSPLR